MKENVMMSPITIELIAKEREADFLREAEMDRKFNAARGARPRLGVRLFSKIGDAFISSGKWLKARFRGEMVVDAKPCPTCNGNACA